MKFRLQNILQGYSTGNLTPACVERSGRHIRPTCTGFLDRPYKSTNEPVLITQSKGSQKKGIIFS